MAKREHRKIDWTPEERARHKAIREKFQREKPAPEQLIASGEFNKPIPTPEYVVVRQLAVTLKRAREHGGLTLADVASRSGLDAAAVSRLENGANLNPTLNTLLRYAAAVGMRLECNLSPASDAKGAVPRAPSASSVELQTFRSLVQAFEALLSALGSEYSHLRQSADVNRADLAGVSARVLGYLEATPR